MHGGQAEREEYKAKGGTRAYACANPMEFFAELSTALHGRNEEEEYNKWFPFNEKQLAQHDTHANLVLRGLWGV